jgi:hypothetical protein
MGDRTMTKTNISILVNVEGVTIEEGAQAAQAVIIRWLANVIRSGIVVQHNDLYRHTVHNLPPRQVKGDEENGIITIKEAHQP